MFLEKYDKQNLLVEEEARMTPLQNWDFYKYDFAIEFFFFN